MSSHGHGHDIQKEVKGYLFVFAGLLFLTIVTVGVSYLHLKIHEAIIVALCIAVIKASLVACFFMHLISERKLVYIILIFTAIFFLSVMSITMSELHQSKIQGTVFVP
jgi:caa(3)-type oxidase subunit IV